MYEVQYVPLILPAHFVNFSMRNILVQQPQFVIRNIVFSLQGVGEGDQRPI